MSSALEPRPRSDGQAAAPAGGPAERPALPGPRILILHAFSQCNCRCQMCDIWQDRRGLAMDPAAIQAEMGDWRAAGLRRVVLSGGEPLMHPRLAELLEALRPVPVTLLSTGILLAAKAAQIQASSVDEVIVSLDGPAELHDAIRRRPGAYARMADGLAALRRAAPRMAQSGRCTVQAANLGRLPDIVRAARELGLDRISFLAVDAHSEAFDRPGGPPGEQASALLPDRAGLAQLERSIARLESEAAGDFASGFIAESPAKLRDRLLGPFRAALGLEDPIAPRCNAPWVSAVVEADGSMRPCFFHPSVARWQPDVQGLLAAFGGPEARAFRDGLVVADHPLCRRCVCSLNLRLDADAGPSGADRAAHGAVI